MGHLTSGTSTPSIHLARRKPGHRNSTRSKDQEATSPAHNQGQASENPQPPQVEASTIIHAAQGHTRNSQDLATTIRYQYAEEARRKQSTQQQADRQQATAKHGATTQENASMQPTPAKARVNWAHAQFQQAYDKAAARTGNKRLKNFGDLSAVQQAYESGEKGPLQENTPQCDFDPAYPPGSIELATDTCEPTLQD
jgi:hypothetical protein